MSRELKASRALGLLGQDQMGEVLLHPAQQALVPRLAELIGLLRVCESPGDYYELQRHVLGELLLLEKRRNECSHVVKRFRRGNGPLARYDPPLNSRDPATVECWELEEFIYERLARQVRSVGDGLAWRRFGYDRRVIVVMSSNQSPGPMYGKIGLPYEVGLVERCWRERGNFALLHDITNCLRIADVTEFFEDRRVVLHEVKQTPRSGTRQMQRVKAAVDALVSGGGVPGGPVGGRLVEVRHPYLSDVHRLNDLFAMARERGVVGMKLSKHRALVGVSLPVSLTRWATEVTEAGKAIESAKRRVLSRAGIGPTDHKLVARSTDTAARSPIMAPFCIYPVDVDDRALLITDLLSYEAVVSLTGIVSRMNELGLRASLLAPGAPGAPSVEEEALWIQRGDTSATVPLAGLWGLALELVDPDGWVAGVAELLARPIPPAHAALVWPGEADIWTSGV